MLRAVFVRTLKPGVSYDDFKDAWMPQDIGEDYPVTMSVSRNASNDRQVITILELDASPAEFAAVVPSLTRHDAVQRLRDIVETTDLEGVYEELFNSTSA